MRKMSLGNNNFKENTQKNDPHLDRYTTRPGALVRIKADHEAAGRARDLVHAMIDGEVVNIVELLSDSEMKMLSP